VSVPPKNRLKQVKRAILEQMALADNCVCRLFFHSAEKPEAGQPKETPPFQPGSELIGEMSTL
jgi:hypothetical protein